MKENACKPKISNKRLVSKCTKNPRSSEPKVFKSTMNKRHKKVFHCDGRVDGNTTHVKVSTSLAIRRVQIQTTEYSQRAFQKV